MSHNDIKTHFTAGDKNSNIDGKIELLTERRVCGNITVQIKTYPQKYYGQSKFDFPTSIFGYAKSCPIELVFLFAVDDKDNCAYWKHIDKGLIIKNEDKFAQETITIHFEDNEIISKDNIEDTVKRWKSLYEKTCELISRAEIIGEENEKFRTQLEKFQNPNFTFCKDYVIKLQRFIDKYNYLLDYEFNYLKKHYFSNPWKIAITVFEYGLKEISYILYNIKNGENGLLIREIPIEKVKEFTDFVVMSKNCQQNDINDNPEKYAIKLIQEKVMELMEKKSILFLTEDISIEYIFDFIKQEGSYLKIKPEDSYDLIPLKEYVENSFPNLDANIPFYLSVGNKRININILYDCILFLLDKGFTFIYRPYPSNEYSGQTGFVSDFYTPELAFKKVKFLYDSMSSLLDAYLIAAFPYLRNMISFYDGYDLLLVNLTYADGIVEKWSQNHQIVVYYLRLCEGRIRAPELITSLNFDSVIYSKNNISNQQSMMDCFYSHKKLSFHEEQFEIMKQEGVDFSIFVGDYYIHNMLYKYLTDRFRGYFDTLIKE